MPSHAIRSAIWASIFASLLAGCATPGPNHTYVASRTRETVIDLPPDGATNIEVPAYLKTQDALSGIAYDPFTDHLFLRVAPGNFVQVIDRPARKIKRRFTVEGLPPGGGDLAIRSRDRHLFFAHPDVPQVVETTLYGRLVRSIPLEDLSSPPTGVAYDQKRNHILILSGDARVVFYDTRGKRLEEISLERAVSPGSLAYDSAAGEIVAVLPGEPAVGFFDTQGRLLRTLPSGGEPDAFIDVGPRSFIRMF